MGAHAVQCLLNGLYNRAVGIKNNRIYDMDLAEALEVKRDFDYDLYNLNNILAMC